MDELEKDKIFTAYNENNLKEVGKIIKNKHLDLMGITNSFGETLLDHFINDKKYDLLAISLKNQKNNLTNPTELLTSLFEGINNKGETFGNKPDQNKVKYFLECANTLIFHPLTNLDSKLVNKITGISMLTSAYPTILNDFLENNSIGADETTKFLKAIKNKKLDSTNKINFKRSVVNTLEYCILQQNIKQTDKNKIKIKV